MFSRLTKAPSIWPIRIVCLPRYIAYNSIRLYTTAVLENSDKLKQLQLAWENELTKDARLALRRRQEVYRKLREFGLHHENADWGCNIITAIPAGEIRYMDYLFAAEALSERHYWSALERLMSHISRESSPMWEQLFGTLLTSQRSPKIPVDLCLRAMISGIRDNDVSLDSINRNENANLVYLLHQVELRYSTKEIIGTLGNMRNKDDAGILASALLRSKVDAIIAESAPQTAKIVKATELIEKSPVTCEESLKKTIKAISLQTALWDWKVEHSLNTDTDLGLYMTYLVYASRSKDSLAVYDAYNDLHSPQQYQALFLACSGAGDYARLQQVFEEVENDSDLGTTVSAERYTVVIKALGRLGEASVLNDIYERLRLHHPERLTRSVYHAFIYSNGMRGDIKAVKTLYHAMIARKIKPNHTTFNMVLMAFRDALDLKSALMFVGDEMIATHQFPLLNSDLSVLLSLCARRRDYKAAEFVWKWASSMITPDEISKVAFLQCFLDANRLDLAWELFETMKPPRIEALTVMLNAAGRSGDTLAFYKKIVSIKNLTMVRGDSQWYLARLRVLRELKNMEQFERCFAQMISQGIEPRAEHYALYLELVAYTKQFSKLDFLMNEIRERKITLEFSLIEKHFRAMVAPGTTEEARRSAERGAFDLVRKGYFDPQSSVVPRGAVPVRVIEPVVKRMIKSGQHVSAKQLLDSLQTQRVNAHQLRDRYLIPALYMEVAYRSNNFGVVEQLWNQFCEGLRSSFVLTVPADEITQPVPVFKVPRRYRKDYPKPISIRIEQLGFDQNKKALLEFPETLDNMGLVMNGHNANTYIRVLAEIDEVKAAFAFGIKIRENLENFVVSNRTASVLAYRLSQGKVNYRDYGMLGYRIRNVMRKMSWTR